MNYRILCVPLFSNNGTRLYWAVRVFPMSLFYLKKTIRPKRKQPKMSEKFHSSCAGRCDEDGKPKNERKTKLLTPKLLRNSDPGVKFWAPSPRPHKVLCCFFFFFNAMGRSEIIRFSNRHYNIIVFKRCCYRRFREISGFRGRRLHDHVDAIAHCAHVRLTIFIYFFFVIPKN